MENPSGDGFRTSDVIIRPLTSDSLSPSLSMSLVHRFCSPNHTIRAIGGVVEVSIANPWNGEAEVDACNDEVHGNGASSPVVWEKCPVLSRCWW